MQLHPTSRSRRVRRLLAVSAAAVAVMIAPTACNYGGAAQMDMPTHSGHMDGMNMDDPAQPGAPEEHQVVPVANQLPATAAPEADDDSATTTANSARSRDDRRRGEDRRIGGRGNPTTKPTIPTPTGTTTATATSTATSSASATASATATPTAPTGPNNGLDVLGRDCSNSKLKPHDGFQDSPACVSTAMGEIAAENKLPSLLITNSPRLVGVNQPFKLVVSTRNLVRDRFLGAAAGGYYLESSFLNAQGLQRGHFHTACRMLASTKQAPDSSIAPAFFLATQDNGGGAAPDSVTIDVPATATKTAGIMQCTSWAGDGSHRTPMMTKANETPAIDSVRILISGRGRAEQVDVSAADAQADATKLAQAEQQQAGAQKPDQDGAVQPLPAGVGTAAGSAAGAAEPAAPAVETPAEIPAPGTAAAN